MIVVIVEERITDVIQGMVPYKVDGGDMPLLDGLLYTALPDQLDLTDLAPSPTSPTKRASDQT